MNYHPLSGALTGYEPDGPKIEKPSTQCHSCGSKDWWWRNGDTCSECTAQSKREDNFVVDIQTGQEGSK